MFRKLLVPLDRSPLAEQAIGQAVAIARASHASVDLVLVHQPVPFAGFTEAPWNAGQWNAEHQYLESMAAEISSGGAVPVTHAVMRGDVAEMICRRARDGDADLVVMSSHGRTGLSRAWLGSVADGVLRRSAIPVLMVRPQKPKPDHPDARHPLERVLVPLDGSALALEILSSASALARCTRARIVLLRVVQPVPLITVESVTPFIYPPAVIDEAATERLRDEAKQELAEAARTLADQGMAEVETHVVVAGYVTQAIIEFARGHDVSAIAMSTHGRGASRLLVGSVADKVLRGSGLPLLLCHPVAVGEGPAFLDAASIAEQLPALSPG